MEVRGVRDSKAWKSSERPVIRRATPADLTALLRLDEALIRYDRRFDPTIDPAWTRSADGRRFFTDRAAGREGIGFVAVVRGRAVGYLVGAVGPAEGYRSVTAVAEVECLFVEPGWRGGGLGRRLLRRFETWTRRCRAERMRVVVSDANRAAIRFYEREGCGRHDAVLERPVRRRSPAGEARPARHWSPASRRRSTPH